ncbi:MAG: GntR family transcriptional regulator [Leadbetterella sp.]
MKKEHHYKKIFNSLKAEIQNGTYPEGSLLPSENELVKSFEISRMTARHALKELSNEGYIERKHGKGSIVINQPKRLGLLNFKGFSEIVKDAKTDIIRNPTLIEWPRSFFFRLSPNQLKSGTIFIERLRYQGLDPLMLEFTYLPSNFKKVITEKLIDESLFKSLKNWYHLEIISMDQSLSAILANDEIASLMKISVNSPLVYIERKYITNNPDIFVYSSLYCYTAKYALSSMT